MAPPDPGDAGSPFQYLLGDLLNLLGSSAPDPWEMTRSFALNVATEGKSEANVEPVERIRLEQLSRVAELNVTEVTGLAVAPGGRRLTCVAVGRGDWTGRALDSWRPVLEAMAPAPAPLPDQPDPDPDAPLEPFAGDQEGGLGDLGGLDVPGGLGGLFGQWAAAIGPLFFSMQVGSVVGHLSHRTLGQYPLAVPWAPSDELLLVTPNITAFADDWSLPEEETLLWVCARELAANAVLSRPGVRARIEELLAEMASSNVSAQEGLSDRLRSLGAGEEGGMGLESLQGMFGDPEALLGELLTPEARRSSDRLTAVAIVVDAYADHVAAEVGAKLVGSHAQLAEAWYRRRTERGKGEEAAGALFGLDLEQAQVDRGRAFVSGVLERAGDPGLAKLWRDGSDLPTPAEVDAPGLWLERISLPPLGGPDTG